MKIAILGTGKVGTTLATALVAVGHEVKLGSRSVAAANRSAVAEPTAVAEPSAVAELVEAPAAAAWADLIVNATPGRASIAYLESIGAEVLGDKILLDVANTFDGKDLAYPNDSLARNIQATFPSLKVVKSLNMFAAAIMVNPSLIAPSSVYLSGDDGDAKSVVSSLLADLGWPKDTQVDLGGIEAARGQEAYFLLFWATMQAVGTGAFNIQLAR